MIKIHISIEFQFQDKSIATTAFTSDWKIRTQRKYNNAFWIFWVLEVISSNLNLIKWQGEESEEASDRSHLQSGGWVQGKESLDSIFPGDTEVGHEYQTKEEVCQGCGALRSHQIIRAAHQMKSY